MVAITGRDVEAGMTVRYPGHWLGPVSVDPGTSLEWLN